ncbi:unnamed protein product [Spirodela intermedia]|uniref:Leucine-rich repeat-containing N-terminal plant-type domain-containing protein n=1 Tax=Spirodela intermedia TaxID=51605 RepID=A0A7I8J604_SPIIN|nr:unnamed protein product [Spirodela intermedia]CAA6665521.1 unnamed protein product [Spirodela intermedia]
MIPGTMLLFLFSVLCAILAVALGDLPADSGVLLLLKHGLTDSEDLLRDWSADGDPCRWKGVACSSEGDRVVGLNLSDSGLLGTIPRNLGGFSLSRASTSLRTPSPGPSARAGHAR